LPVVELHPDILLHPHRKPVFGSKPEVVQFETIRVEFTGVEPSHATPVVELNP
jgi:hypothetical protein